LVVLAAGCQKKATLPGVAVADMGADLSTHADAVPGGARACSLEEALKRQGGDQKKCDGARASDQLWSTSLKVLGAYSRSLGALARGTDPEYSGGIEAELTLVRDESFVEVEDEKEQAARKAAYELVTQLQSRDDDAKIESVINDAAPQVQTLCDGLLEYLGDQEQRLAKVHTEIVTKLQASPGPPRCTTIAGQNACVGNSLLDFVVYSEVDASLTRQQEQHENARNAVAAFCVAHYTVAQEAAAGKLKGDETYTKVQTAVHDAIPVGPPAGAAEPAQP
jgi:hypothetical protein